MVLSTGVLFILSGSEGVSCVLLKINYSGGGAGT